MDEPFLEHPSDDDFESVVEAMTVAIRRLRKLARWDKWMTFQAQGMGPREDSYQDADILMLQNSIRLTEEVTLDLAAIAKKAKLPEGNLVETGKNTYSLGEANPKQAARVLDVIFRDYHGIRPHPDEDGDVDLEEDDYELEVFWLEDDDQESEI